MSRLKTVAWKKQTRSSKPGLKKVERNRTMAKWEMWLTVSRLLLKASLHLAVAAIVAVDKASVAEELSIEEQMMIVKR